MLLYTKKTVSELKNNSICSFTVKNIIALLITYFVLNASLQKIIKDNPKIKFILKNFFLGLIITIVLIILYSFIEFKILKRLLLSHTFKQRIYYNIILIPFEMAILLNYSILYYPTPRVYDFHWMLSQSLLITLIMSYSRWNFINRINQN